MTAHKVLPRYSVVHARERLTEIERRLSDGAIPAELVDLSFGAAAPNATGGQAAAIDDLSEWRHLVLERLAPAANLQTKMGRDQYGIILGRALEEVIHPGPSDAAHDGVWSFLALKVFPDIVHARWPMSGRRLPADRWIGKQGGGRDRNFLKLSWRRWKALGTVLEVPEGKVCLGEDEFGALLERSSLARNNSLIRVAAREIIDYAGRGPRMQFTRELMKLITYQTGPLDLQILSVEDLAEIVHSCAITAERVASEHEEYIADVTFTRNGEEVVLEVEELAHPRRALG